MSAYRFTSRAHLDLEGIALSVARPSVLAANRLVDKIEEKCRLLAPLPALGTPCEEWAPGLRYLPVDNYVIYCRPVTAGVEIVRVVHGGRDLKGIFPSN